MRSTPYSSALALFALSTMGFAQIITSPGELNPGASVIDFESLTAGPVNNPFALSGVEFSSNSGLGLASVSQYGANGGNVEELTLIPVSSGTFPSNGYVTTRITFDPPVSEMGFGWFDPNSPNNLLRVFAIDGTILVEGTPALFAPGGCCAAFIGAAFATDVIAAVEVIPHNAGDWYSIDNLHFYSNGCNAPTNYCSTSPNSSSVGAIMRATGSTSIADNSFGLEVTGAVFQSTGLFYYGSTQTQQPFGAGLRCVGGAVYRLGPPQQTDISGTATRQLDFTMPPTGGGGPGAITPMSTWNFQFWFRDTMGALSGFNLSDGLTATFCP